MVQKQFGVRLSEEYISKIQLLAYELKCPTQRELIMFLVDNYKKNDIEELKKENEALKLELELEKKSQKKFMFEQKKQTAMLNQMMFAFMPDESDITIFEEHLFMEKWENKMRNEQKKY